MGMHIIYFKDSSAWHDPKFCKQLLSSIQFCSPLSDRTALEPFTRGKVSINTPLQPNFTCPQTCMQAFLHNPTLSHLSLSSTESNP